MLLFLTRSSIADLSGLFRNFVEFSHKMANFLNFFDFCLKLDSISWYRIYPLQLLFEIRPCWSALVNNWWSEALFSGVNLSKNLPCILHNLRMKQVGMFLSGILFVQFWVLYLLSLILFSQISQTFWKIGKYGQKLSKIRQKVQMVDISDPCW